MFSFLLQDWTTLKGVSGASTVVILQAEDDWLSLVGFRDLTVWQQVTEASGAPAFNVETLPSYDATLAKTIATTNAAAVNVNVARGDGSSTPLFDLVRWNVTIPPSTTWSITFRVFVCVSPIDRTLRVVQGSRVLTA